MKLNPLLPLHHNTDLFFCDIFDAAPKSDTASMEHPLFTLSTKPDMAAREYQHGDVWVKLSPSATGLATVHDRDILIYLISQCMAALNKGQPVAKTMRFSAHDLLVMTNRKTSGEGYKLFQAALRRLQGTQIETNIMTNGQETWKIFSFIESATVIKETREGRMQEMEVTLSDWVFNAINEKGSDILTLSRDYFRLRKPLERRLYEIARKHCGHQPYWHIGLESLHKKTGSTSRLKEFRRMLKDIILANEKHHHIPDYDFFLEDDLVSVRPKETLKDIYLGQSKENISIHLSSETYEKAKEIAPDHDIYHLEQSWLDMMKDRQEKPTNQGAAFIGFVKWYVNHNAA